MKQPMLILIGPSGVGKSSFLERALAEFPVLCDTITYTTRAMRQGEAEGQPYHFVSTNRFQELINQNFFVEYAQVHGNFYGTPYIQLEEAWRDGKIVVMDVDVQGAKTFKAKFPQAKTVFILPPSLDSLRQRLVRRESKVPKDLELRLENAKKEIALAAQFDHQIVNDDFDEAYAALKKLIEDLPRSQ